MDNEIRSFIAVKLSPDICEKILLLQKELKKDFEDVRWTKKENLHLTLKFLGNIPSGSVDDISGILDKSLNNFSKMIFNIYDIGVFPDERRPRVLWTGLDGDISKLGHMADTINKDISFMGFSKTKKHFTPHITIGRFKNKKNYNDIRTSIEKGSYLVSGNFIMDEIVMYQSILGKKGADYIPLFKKRLKN